MDKVLNRLNTILCNIDIYLSKQNDLKGHRVFYGDAFLYAYLEKSQSKNLNLKSNLIKNIKNQNWEAPNCHFEFINYALLDLERQQLDPGLYHYLDHMRFRGTNNTNWSLLRNLCLLKKSKVSSDYENIVSEIVFVLSKNQLRSGLIKDSNMDLSFQYHCFSASLVAEAYLISKDKRLLDIFNHSIEFILKFILNSGHGLYIGRGQFQSFGLGALLYSLVLYLKFNPEMDITNKIDNVVSLIESIQLKDGQIPLSFLTSEDKIENVDLKKESFVGWYSYNNFYDYYGFLTYFIFKARNELSELSFRKISSNFLKIEDYHDQNFIIKKMKNYVAIISRPQGLWSNSQSVPLIEYQNMFQTPVSGGEQFVDSLISSKNLSLPHVAFFNIPWTRFCRSTLSNDTLSIYSIFGIFKRKYFFYEDKVLIKDISIPFFFSKNYFNFLSDSKLKIQFKRKSVFIGYSHSPSGKLNCYQSPLNQELIIEIQDE